MIANRGAEGVGAMLGRYAAKLPERVLDSLAECLEGFGEAQRDGLEVAVCQHAVKQRVLESLTGDLAFPSEANC